MREMPEKRMIHGGLAALLLLSASPMLALNDGLATAVTWQPDKLVRGSPVLFHVRTPAGVRELTGTWFGRDLKFSPLKNHRGFYALGGIPIETSPGTYDLELNGRRSTGTFHLLRKVRIGPARYPRVAITVAKQFTEPSAEQLKQIDADKQVKQAVFSKMTGAQLWQGDFLKPAEGPASGVFGTERVFNGKVQSRHLGLDYAVPSGTPVRAINAGRVVLAQQLYFEGGFIVIDHGLGLMSLYLHLSDFKVKPGDDVVAGQVIAASGGSGRATGPHLHLAVRWQGIYLDPAVVLRLQVPK
jgi:murein DD-endopeptidase MepM/ murein hydrolase activator NlpD